MRPSDEQWFNDLYREAAPKIYQIALYRLQDKSYAEDIVQETFLALVGKIAHVRYHPNPTGWLMVTARFLLLQKLKEDARRTKTALREEGVLAETTTPAQAPSLGDILPPGLTPREQMLLIWFFEENLSYQEIADRLQIPVLTCRTQMFRSRKHYRKLAEKDQTFLETMS